MIIKKKLMQRIFYRRPYYSLARLYLVLFCFVVYFFILIGRLINIQFNHNNHYLKTFLTGTIIARPKILDRNGYLLAGDIDIFSLYANPKQIENIEETVELIHNILPETNLVTLEKKLKNNNNFVWLARGLTPKQRDAIMELGIPALGFRKEVKRVYPANNITSHVVGLVDVDNKAISGIEKYIDDNELYKIKETSNALTDDKISPIYLSLDLKIQTKVHQIVKEFMYKHKAKAAGAVILNIKTGEVMSSVSLPDFDPLNMKEALLDDRLNRIVAGVYEMGSILKSFTTAVLLEKGEYNLNSIFDVSRPLVFGKQTINDFHGKKRPLKVWEIFIFSSNIGSALEAQAVGIDFHKNFLKRLGLLDRLRTELSENAAPIYPRKWQAINSATIAFGHGLAITPLQIATSEATLMNNGRYIPPTFLKRDRKTAEQLEQQLIKETTSKQIRYLNWLNGVLGSGRLARVEGYRVGGKTGTAEKVVNGRYQSGKRFNSYLATFPIDDPSYIVLTIIDEPQKLASDPSAVAAYNAGRMAAAIIKRVAFDLNIEPNFYLEGRPPYLREEDRPK
ncbi:peptidoglycan D,D-transpeptidase FtsI family protein [Bartonella sp. DGB1]|uniref:peptidoglycan D,D-transpeptidase FtsI family protein n=1 Tax=Bartonella sp. DGB1 TaxID=3239807 RepID=UPI0035269B62